MGDSDYKYGRNGQGALAWLVLTVAAVGVLVFSLDHDADGGQSGEQTLVVYCAAGVKKAVEEAAGRFEQEIGAKVSLEYASSGVLANRLKIDKEGGLPRADVYVPADYVFAERARADGLTAESLKVATWKVVLAVKPDSALAVTDCNDVLARNVSFVICNPLAGVGKKTKNMLERSGHWAAVDAAKAASFPTVTEAALAVKENPGTQAAFIWDSIAQQFGLRAIELPELEASKANITVAVTATTAQPTLALKFTRYLAAPTQGGAVFAKHHYVSIPGDEWAETPKLRVDCGGVNREAVEKTIREFQQREGASIDVVYAGCGTLVGKMQTGEHGLPDVFMTCDASYLDMAQKKMNHPFGPDLKVSSTRIVMLVAKGNPHGIRSLTGLAKRGLRVGTTDPKASTLGALSHQLCRETGQFDAIEQNIVMMADTAHTLVQTMEAGQKLDVVIVYEANIRHMIDRFDAVPLQPKRALAVQNVAARKTTPYPRLAGRLMEHLTSQVSRRRFEQLGFSWEANGE
ncbi:MAG TPA: substrate-binding domain-containing protein [Verrucomicrobiota bacterium]|nr:substrate-binding domain-containing protein [Verrucomicrobiota bacterium]